MIEMRAVSVSHVEYEILRYILENIDMSNVKDEMVTDKVSEKRFTQGGQTVMMLVENLAERRRHKLPTDHEDYQEKVKK